MDSKVTQLDRNKNEIMTDNLHYISSILTSLGHQQNDRHFPKEIFNCMSSNKDYSISIHILLKSLVYWRHMQSRKPQWNYLHPKPNSTTLTSMLFSYSTGMVILDNNDNHEICLFITEDSILWDLSSPCCSGIGELQSQQFGRYPTGQTLWHQTKPFHEPMLIYCQLGPWEQTSVKCESEWKRIQLKCRLQNVDNFVKISMCYGLDAMNTWRLSVLIRFLFLFNCVSLS